MGSSSQVYIVFGSSAIVTCVRGAASGSTWYHSGMDVSVSVLVGWTCCLLSVVILAGVSLSSYLWRLRGLLAVLVTIIMAIPIGFAAAYTLEFDGSAAVAYVLIASLIIFYAFRLAKGRLDEAFVRGGTLRDSGVLVLASMGLPLSQTVGVSPQFAVAGLYIYLAVAAGIAVFFALQAFGNVRRYQLPAADGSPRPQHVPSVTLAIPARNETHELAHCLDAALASNYPKLEIVVLDDCSQDKTSELIRAYAQSGVRFIKGEAPSDDWLGKNNAYEELLEQASGSMIVFASVDTRLRVTTITELVNYAEKTKADMVSLLPQQREDYPAPSLFPGLRHVWEVILPEFSSRVPVATACWLVRRKALMAAGGFDQARADIVPERRIAGFFAAARAYSYVIASGSFAPTHGKKWSSLVDSSVRLLYPNLRREPLLALLAALCLGLFGVLPFILAVVLTGFVQVTAALIAVTLVVAYGIVLKRLQPRTWWLGVWLLPLVVIQEILLIVTSMIRYEFMRVDWKGRNVCYPVMSRKTNF